MMRRLLIALALLPSLVLGSLFAEDIWAQTGNPTFNETPLQQYPTQLKRTILNQFLSGGYLGNTTTASNQITGLNSLVGINVGDAVSGTGVPTGAFVVNILTSGQVNFSGQVGASSSNTATAITFAHQWYPQPTSTWFRVKIVGGGGGGGCGVASALAAPGGGGGGAAGWVVSDWINIADFFATQYWTGLPVPVVAGAAGSGCIGGTTPANGVNSSFNASGTVFPLVSYGAGAGSNAAAATARAGGAGTSPATVTQSGIAASGGTGGTATRGGGNGGSGVLGTTITVPFAGSGGGGDSATGGAGTNGAGSIWGPTGGASGGGCPSTCTALSEFGGGAAQNNGFGYIAVGGLTPGTLPAPSFSMNCFPGVGGAGGAANATGIAQAGGTGGYGAGGAGGGGTNSGTPGNGGNGGPGQVCIEEM